MAAGPGGKKALLVVVFWMGHLHKIMCDAFVVYNCPNTKEAIRPATFLAAVQKKKLSMAEKRKRRAKVLNNNNRQSPLADLPKSELDYSKPSPPTEASTPNARPADAPATTKAQQLLETQRKSVAMLTQVKVCMEQLPVEELSQALQCQGFWYTDDFLGGENDENVNISNTMLSELQTEGTDLLETMSLDMDNLGAGEYIVNLQGGQEQYAQAPRSVEWVVSSTKHFPKLLPDGAAAALDASNCMGVMRTFDRKAYQASLELLTGGDSSAQNEETPATTNFAPVVSDEEDGRRISMRYYMVPNGWDHGGGLEFSAAGAANTDDDDNNSNMVRAKRDRLVVWKSDLPFRKQAWVGSDEFMLASCIELHLIAAPPEQ